VPVNLASAAESDLRTAAWKTDDPTVHASDATSTIVAHHDWSWLAALCALALLAFDVWYLTRAPRASAFSSAAARPLLPERRRGS
jgi:hypothetical protein